MMNPMIWNTQIDSKPIDSKPLSLQNAVDLNARMTRFEVNPSKLNKPRITSSKIIGYDNILKQYNILEQDNVLDWSGTLRFLFPFYISTFFILSLCIFFWMFARYATVDFAAAAFHESAFHGILILPILFAFLLSTLPILRMIYTYNTLFGEKTFQAKNVQTKTARCHPVFCACSVLCLSNALELFYSIEFCVAEALSKPMLKINQIETNRTILQKNNTINFFPKIFNLHIIAKPHRYSAEKRYRY